jgi:hypothetical protein
MTGCYGGKTNTESQQVFLTSLFEHFDSVDTQDEVDEVGFCFPAVGVGEGGEEAHFVAVDGLELFLEHNLKSSVFLKQTGDKLDQSIHEARTGVESKAGYDFFENG